jgi:hypothetical protein
MAPTPPPQLQRLASRAGASSKPAALQSIAPSQSDTLSFGSIPLAIESNSGNLLTQNLAAQAGATVELRADICTSVSSAAPADVLVFDGDPSEGNLIAWKRVYLPNPKQCEGTWFDWTPTEGRHDLAAAILQNGAPPILPDNVQVPPENLIAAEASLRVAVP